MGEIKSSRKPAVFSCSGLGSCVMLFVYDASTAIGGVAHIMLPNYVRTDTGMGHGHYANTSPSILIQQLLASGANPARLRAKIVGGANVFSWATSDHMTELGRENFERVRKTLLENKIYIAAEEMGGPGYQSVRCNTSTGEVTIKTDKETLKVI
jgi:chemotaxis protein CheD